MKTELLILISLFAILTACEKDETEEISDQEKCNIVGMTTIRDGVKVYEEIYNYNEKNRLIEVDIYGLRDSSISFLYGMILNYDNNGNLIQTNAGTSVISYMYDSKNRLIRVHRDRTSTSDVTFTYDYNDKDQTIMKKYFLNEILNRYEIITYNSEHNITNLKEYELKVDGDINSAFLRSELRNFIYNAYKKVPKFNSNMDYESKNYPTEFESVKYNEDGTIDYSSNLISEDTYQVNEMGYVTEIGFRALGSDYIYSYEYSCKE